MNVIVGNCAICGAPIYAPTFWSGTMPPQSIKSCGCSITIKTVLNVPTNENDKMNFGQALEALKEGKKVARKGWNGKGMWVRIVEAATIGNNTNILSFFIIKNISDTFNTWVPSVSDLLAEDWSVVD